HSSGQPLRSSQKKACRPWSWPWPDWSQPVSSLVTQPSTKPAASPHFCLFSAGAQRDNHRPHRPEPPLHSCRTWALPGWQSPDDPPTPRLNLMSDNLPQDSSERALSTDAAHDPGYEPLVDLSGVAAESKAAEEIDLKSLVPRDAIRRRGLFTKALKYMDMA